MKKILGILITLFFFNSGFSQHDPVAKNILDALSEKNKSYSTITADFLYIMKNQEADIDEEFNGTAYLKDEKYKLDLNGNEIFSDGISKWVYLADAGEVQISNIADQESEDDTDILNNPTKIFSIYEEGFKYMYISESVVDNVKVDEIDLVPDDIEKPYFKIKIKIDKTQKHVKSIKYFGKDGSRYTIIITRFETNKELKDEMFVFNISNYDDVIEVDLRE